MKWKEIIEELKTLNKAFWNMKSAVFILDSEEANGDKIHYIVEISSRGLGGTFDYLGDGEDDPRNNDEYNLTIWTEPVEDKNKSRSMTWGQIIEEFNELPQHFGKLDAVISVYSEEEGDFKCYKIVALVPARRSGKSIELNTEFSDQSFIIAGAEPTTEFESWGSIADDRDKIIDDILSTC